MFERLPFFNLFAPRTIRLLMYLLSQLAYPGLYVITEYDKELDTSQINLQNNNDQFDFIIVGAGSSGSSLASRLTLADYSVLLLEAGGTPSPIHAFPLYSYLQNADLDVNWKYKTVPQKNACFGMNKNVCHWPAGKVLGGSSILNAMMYLRGNVQGFDEIAEKTGDNRWNLTNVLKYYKNLENYNGWFEPSDQHGVNGSMSVERTGIQPFTERMMEAGKELGYPVRDPNPYGPYTEGFAKLDLHMKDGRRHDTFQHFILPAMKRSNKLVVRKFSHVTKILFQKNNEAYGVEYLRHEKRYIATAKLEVILSAGTIRSPQLLMLSGIGPKDHLAELGIKTRINLPVGQHLQDKYGVFLGPFLVEKYQALVLERDLRLIDMVQWYRSGSGPFRTALGDGTYAIITEKAKRNNRTTKPDIHTYILSTTLTNELRRMLVEAYNYKPEIFEYFSKAAYTDSFIQLVTLNNPIGDGTLKLKDKNPFSHPVIDPRYLQNQDDVDTLVEGAKFAVKLVESTKSIQKIVGRFSPNLLPGCEEYKWKSDEYYECFIRHMTITAFKYSSTVPIGRDMSDPVAVVDSHLRVLGTKRLRVVDGSVLQHRHTSINDVTCRMLGQLAGDIIIDDKVQNPASF
ncbi:unnamed protein product [Orchesella dallaii]|uniref:Glucose-methanol-choline oxidoreductase N-terminal domain-containing protein n=1 Tax=Orchesella dallaii TaxID=48710 RepID=A0ABP1PVX2_9HEXA